VPALSGKLCDNVCYQMGLVTEIADVAEMWGMVDHKTVRTVRFFAHKANTFLDHPDKEWTKEVKLETDSKCSL
jgi:hypothetical protein